MIYFQLPRKKPSLQEIPTDQYIKRDENGVTYTTGGQVAVDKMHQNLIG